MKPGRWISMGLAAMALGGAILLAATSENDSAPAAPRAERRAVETGRVTESVDGREVRLAGITRARSRAALAFDASGRITERLVDVGDHLRAGELVARLDSRQLDHAVTSARASLTELDVRLAQAERERDRTARLAAAKAATLEELERDAATVEALLAARESAEARLADAERAAGETIVRAPFSGTVTDVHREPGEYVTYGQPVITLSGDGPVELQVEVPESLLGNLREGQRVIVELPLLGREIQARVSSVARAATGAGRLFPVVVELPGGEEVLAGLTAELVVSVRSGSGVSVPLAAVHDPGGSRPSVFRVEKGLARRAEIEIEGFHGDRVSVRGDLAVGQLVVVSGHQALADGDAVEVRR